MKAVIAYTTNYITKPGLCTHTMMEIIKSVFTWNSDLLQGESPRAEKAQRLMVQIVNAITVQQEIGSLIVTIRSLLLFISFFFFFSQVWEFDVACTRVYAATHDSLP